MDIASQAMANAISLEVKKDGLQQRQNGDWILRFTVAAIGMDQSITQAPMGTRYQCVLVEINDDETPVDRKAMERDRWRELGPTKQAGIRCKDPIFWAWLCETQSFPHIENEAMAASALRELLGIESRRDLEKPGHTAARLDWFNLDFKFQAWKAAEHA